MSRSCRGASQRGWLELVLQNASRTLCTAGQLQFTSPSPCQDPLTSCNLRMRFNMPTMFASCLRSHACRSEAGKFKIFRPGLLKRRKGEVDGESVSCRGRR